MQKVWININCVGMFTHTHTQTNSTARDYMKGIFLLHYNFQFLTVGWKSIVSFRTSRALFNCFYVYEAYDTFSCEFIPIQVQIFNSFFPLFQTLSLFFLCVKAKYGICIQVAEFGKWSKITWKSVECQENTFLRKKFMNKNVGYGHFK